MPSSGLLGLYLRAGDSNNDNNAKENKGPPQSYLTILQDSTDTARCVTLACRFLLWKMKTLAEKDEMIYAAKMPKTMPGSQ